MCLLVDEQLNEVLLCCVPVRGLAQYINELSDQLQAPLELLLAFTGGQVAAYGARAVAGRLLASGAT